MLLIFPLDRFVDESQIEMVPTNMHILQERYSFSAGQSISLVSQYFNLIPKAYFRKMVEVFEIIFTFGFWMLSLPILYRYVIASSIENMGSSQSTQKSGWSFLCASPVEFMNFAQNCSAKSWRTARFREITSLRRFHAKALWWPHQSDFSNG